MPLRAAGSAAQRAGFRPVDGFRIPLQTAVYFV